jgi:hypothetical protein
LLAGVAVVLWRHFRREGEKRELSNQNLTYFTDEPAREASPEEKIVAGPEYRSPQINTASNF